MVTWDPCPVMSSLMMVPSKFPSALLLWTSNAKQRSIYYACLAQLPDRSSLLGLVDSSIYKRHCHVVLCQTRELSTLINSAATSSHKRKILVPLRAGVHLSASCRGWPALANRALNISRRLAGPLGGAQGKTCIRRLVGPHDGAPG